MTKPLSGVGGAPNLGSVMLNARTTPAAEPPAGKATIDVVNGRPGSRINGEARKPLAFNAEAQPLARWLVADAAALAALSVTADDVGYVARQAAPLGFYRLASAGPAVWELISAQPTTDASQLTTGTLPRARLPAPTTTELGGVKRNTGSAGQFVTGFDADGNILRDTPAAGGGTHSRGTWAARPGSPAVGDSYLVTDLPQTLLRCWSSGAWTVYWRGVEVTPVNSGWTQRNFAGAAALNALGPYTEFVGDSSNNSQIALAVRSRTVASPWFAEIGLTSALNYGIAAEVEGGGYWAATLNHATSGYAFQSWSSTFGFAGNISSIATYISPAFVRFESVSSSLVRIRVSEDRVHWRTLTEQAANANLLDEAPTIGVIVRNILPFANRSVITHWAHGSL